MREPLFENAGIDGVEPEPGAQETVAAAEHRLRGEVLRVVFSSDDGQYVVARLLDTEGTENTIVGPLGGVLDGQDIEATGRWEQHREHGRQFRVAQFKAVLPTTEIGIRRYLASGLIPGIGPKFAERIVDHFGAETLDVLERYSSRLKQVPGIGPKRIAEIRRAWKEHAEQRDILVFLQGLGISPAYCARVIARYGVAAAEVVRKNPYQLAAEVHGIGFLSADRIARNLGIEKDNPLRLGAGIAYVLDKLAEQGHTCYQEGLLLDAAAETLGVPREQAAVGLERALANGTVVADAGCPENGASGEPFIYHRRLYHAELELSDMLDVLMRCPGPRMTAPVEHLGKDYEVLNEAQRRAVEAAFAANVSIITGGPGVGKTTVVGQIVQAARRLGCYVLLAAPTGRAAKRLSESTHLEAKTVHRLLKWDPQTRAFVFNRDRPLRCDLLILDEVSMLDVMLAHQLIQAVPAGTHLVLVGDRDQLPSVGPGAVLHDLIASGRIPVTHLTEIYRQAENSRIVLNAHAVNRGDMPDLQRAPPRKLADFYWIDQDDPERVADIIARMVAERIPQRFRVNPRVDVQVLAPMHRGSCGAIALNDMLQDRLNPGPKPEFRFGDRKYRSGDRVMQTVNNYDKSVFNGELGQIQHIDSRNKTFTVAFDFAVIEYACQEADQIQLAYAVTVHKSQGSEFPVVVMPLLTQHYIMLQRNLVYTGMTRAERLLVMVGTRKALAIAIRNDRPLTRCTRLAQRLARHQPP